VKDHLPQGNFKRDMGIILGHAIAHELGHLLMPGQPHSNEGLMRAEWGYRQAEDAIGGRLLFQPAHAGLIRSRLGFN
jgi:hypothetical protein